MGNLVWVFAVSASPLSVDRVAGVLAGVDGEAGDHAELRAPGKLVERAEAIGAHVLQLLRVS